MMGKSKLTPIEEDALNQLFMEKQEVVAGIKFHEQKLRELRTRKKQLRFSVLGEKFGLSEKRVFAKSVGQ